MVIKPGDVRFLLKINVLEDNEVTSCEVLSVISILTWRMSYIWLYRPRYYVNGA